MIALGGIVLIIQNEGKAVHVNKVFVALLFLT
jgi:hypothetical protein